MKKHLLCLFFLIFFSTIRADDQKPLCIDSDFLSFDGKVIILNGNASVDHELGKVEAQAMTLLPEAQEKKWRFAYLKINQGVKISMHDGGELKCESAEIDYQTLTGKFLGDAQQKYVTYTEYLKTGNTKNIPLEVKSRMMTLYLQPENKQQSSVFISRITAENDVKINYNQDLFAQADYGQYERREQTENAPQSKTAGILSLHANTDNGTCQVSHRRGDLINANKISFDTLKHEIHFYQPKGSFFTEGEKESSQEVIFSCGIMHWNEMQDILTLQEEVEINYRGIGTLSNPQEIKVYRQLKNGQKQVSLIECLGPSTLSYQDEKKNENHVLKTHHKFILDHQRMQAYMDSPRDEENQVIDDMQVHFNDPMGEIFADELFVFYKEINNKMTPVKLLLRGKVWLLSRTSIDKDDPGKILQFAMADRVEYDISSKEMLCLADFGKRVLFFDKSNNLQISAPSVKAKRDPNSQKDSIQGIGDVRFSFIDKEFEQLKNRFKGYDLN